MNKFSKYYRFLSRDMWRTTASGFSRSKRIGLATLKTLALSAKGFNQNDLNMRANSLTYSMMFAIVPILALIVAIARGFGFEAIIESSLQQSFLANYDIVPTIMGFVNRYLETAQGGVFLGIGMLILLWAIYSFFRNVESSFNKIWQVNQSRSYVRQFANYITILILVPVLIVLSSGVSIYLSSHEALAQMHQALHQSALHDMLIRLIPWGSTCFIMFCMYIMIPNTKVKLMSALIPGLLIGTFVYALQSLSVYIIMFLSRTSIVYGTFAAIPLLLTWLQWTCLLILTGAEISYSIQNNESMDFAHDTEVMSRRYKDYLTLYICYQIVHRFEQCEEPLSAQEIAHMDNLPARNVNQLLSRLVEVRILNRIGDTSETEDPKYQPALDINKLTVGMLFAHVERQGEEGFFPHLPKEMRSFWDKWINAERTHQQFEDTLVKDILK